MMRWEKMGLRAAGEKGKYVTTLHIKRFFFFSLDMSLLWFE